MVESEYAVFKRFPDKESAEDLAVELLNQGIDSKLVNNSLAVDVTFSGSTVNNQIELKILQSDFNQARKILEKLMESDLEQMEKDHYLFGFTDEELLDVLKKSDEWSEFDVSASRKILETRGEEISDKDIEGFNTNRLEELSKPESSPKLWIGLGYLFSFAGGFLGMIIGYFLMSQKRTLPNGEKVPTYTMLDRKNGKIMFIIGLVVTPLTVIARLAFWDVIIDLAYFY